MGAGYTGDLNASRAAAASGARLARRGQEAGEAGIRVVEGQDLPEVVAGVGQRPGAVLTHADAVTPAVTAHQQPPCTRKLIDFRPQPRACWLSNVPPRS